MREHYTIMKTDFARCKTSVFTQVPILKFRNATAAWDATMEAIKKQNAKSDGTTFFWLKYK